MAFSNHIVRTFALTGLAAFIHISTVQANADDAATETVFNRIASFPVFQNTDIERETVAEIVAASGNTLVYTDSQTGKVGFVDISHPRNPQPLGAIDVGGEPTSVGVRGNFALVAVNTSPSFTSPSGKLMVINIANQTVRAELPLDGQPDAVAVSPAGRYAAIAIENERNEDLGDGRPPQSPSGFLVIVDMIGAPGNWTIRDVSLEGIADNFTNDVEAEYVDINSRNEAVVTLQENNHIILVDLPSATVIGDFNAGTVDIENIDTSENDLIELNTSLKDIPREPDGVAWITDDVFATANEGDLDGGSRGFTIFKKSGEVLFDSGNSMEHKVASLGHYPEDRSENRGNEPENVEVGRYGPNTLLFVGSERSNLVFVYNVNNPASPELLQVLPTGVAPEGLLALPRGGGQSLFIAASEDDARDDGIRSVLNIYRYRREDRVYPYIESARREDGTPIPWAALSALASDPADDDRLYSIYDSFFNKSRIFGMDIASTPAVINNEIVLSDAMGKLAAVNPDQVNADGTVNLDGEGLTVSQNGGFWVASEGAGTVGDADRPVVTANLLLKVTDTGLIEKVVVLPAQTNARQRRFGFEGVASVGSGMEEVLFVAFQREWADDPDDQVRIGRYQVATGEWSYYYYPLETPASPNGGWVGLSEIVALAEESFAVVERDNQAGTDARIKRIYEFSIAGLTPLADTPPGTTPSFPLVNKYLVRDLLSDLRAPGGLVQEKVEGLAITSMGDVIIVTDNDGVDDANGETQLLRFKNEF